MITKEICASSLETSEERDVGGWVYNNNMDFGVSGKIFISKNAIDYANETGKYFPYLKQEILKEMEPLILIGRGIEANVVYH